MQREIIFRGKQIDLDEPGDWFYGFYVHDDEDAIIMQWNDELDRFEEYGVREETIGQYTGLKDKNGKDIYEGDIVEDGLGERMLVVWDQFDAKWIFLDSDMGYSVDGDDCKRVKVVGNKWDNPELMKGSAE